MVAWQCMQCSLSNTHVELDSSLSLQHHQTQQAYPASGRDSWRGRAGVALALVSPLLMPSYGHWQAGALGWTRSGALTLSRCL